MSFHKIYLCLLLFVCLFSNILPAQKIDSTKVTIAEIKIIHSTILNEDRKIYVYNPDISLSQPLPVLYLLDGENISLVAGIFENWKPAKSDTTIELVLKFYQKRSEQNGFEELPPEQVINEMGYKFLNSPNKLDEAIKCFELNTINYPSSFNAFDNLGDGYSAKGDKEKAIEAYKKSIAINPNAEETRRKLKALE